MAPLFMAKISLDPLSARPLVMVCIVTRNRKSDLMRALASCEAQSYQPFEIAVYDGGSSDGTREAVEQSFPGVRLIKVEADPGFTALRNRAVHETEAEIVVSIDDDTYFTSKDILAQLVNDFRANPGAAAVAIPFIAPRPPASGKSCSDDVSSDYVRLAAFTGCACALRRSAVLAAGGYREIPGYQKEDRDLSIRLLEAGFGIVLGKTDPAVHDFSSSRDFEKRYDQAIRTALVFDMLNVPLRYLPVRWILDTCGLLVYKFRPASIMRRLRAVVAGFRECWIHRELRKPVSLKAYSAYRRLPVHEPLQWSQAVPVPIGKKC